MSTDKPTPGRARGWKLFDDDMSAVANGSPFRVCYFLNQKDTLRLEATVAEMRAALEKIAKHVYSSNGDGTESDNVPNYELREMARKALASAPSGEVSFPKIILAHSRGMSDW